MYGNHNPFGAMMPSQFLSSRKGPTLQGLLIAALLVALAVPALFVALQPGSAVGGQEVVRGRCPAAQNNTARLEECLDSVELEGVDSSITTTVYLTG